MTDQGRKQTPDPRFVEMVKKKIRQGGFKRWAFLQPFHHIGSHHGGQPVAPAEVIEGGFRNHRLPVDKKDPGPVSAFRVAAQENRAKEGAIASAKIGQRRGRSDGIILGKPPRPQTYLAED